MEHTALFLVILTFSSFCSLAIALRFHGGSRSHAPVRPPVYDVTSRTSFEHLETWFNELEMYTSSKDVVKMIIGNQIDKVPIAPPTDLMLTNIFP